MFQIKTRFAAANYKRLLPFLDAVDRTPEKHFRFTVGGEDSAYMPLSIENMEYAFNDCPVYSMMHFYIQNGDLMRDPDMTFYLDRQNGYIIPMTFQMDGGIPQYCEAFESPESYSTNMLRQMDQFLNRWTKNILAQGFESWQANIAISNEVTPEEFAASIEE